MLRIGGALADAAARGVEHGWVNLDNIVVDERGQLFLTNFVVSPTTRGHDAADFASVLRATVDRCDPRLPGHVERSLESVLDAPGDSIECFVDAVTTALATQPAPMDVRVNPFKGLRAFDETDAGDFYGRDELVGELCDANRDGRHRKADARRRRVRQREVERRARRPRSRGPRRQGGTRMVRHHDAAGCVPVQGTRRSLRRVAVNDIVDLATNLQNGSTTVADAAAAAVPADGSVLLVIDQFEELFTLTPIAEQAAFLDAIATVVTDPRRPDPRRGHPARRLLRSAARRSNDSGHSSVMRR